MYQLTCSYGLIFVLLCGYSGFVSAQEGVQAPPPAAPIPRADVYNQTGQLIYIPPVPLAFTYPGPLPVPGVSWPFLGGIGYIAEGRFPYNGYVGTRSPYLALLNRVKYDDYSSKGYGSGWGSSSDSSYGGSSGGYGSSGYGGGGYGGTSGYSGGMSGSYSGSTYGGSPSYSGGSMYGR